MSRPRKPTELLELNGAFKHDPSRRRPISPKSTGDVGDPPDYFAMNEKAAWFELIAISAAGVLTAADRVVLEMTARLLAKYRIGTLSHHETKDLQWCLSHLGLSPADRSKILPGSSDSLGPSSPFSEFTN